MTATLEQTTVTISADLPCDHQFCTDHATALFNQLNTPHYSTGASVMECPATLEEWRSQHRTARKRADRAARLGYVAGEVDFSLYSDDIFAINTSLTVRQGRPMAAGYTVRRQHGKLSADQTRCPRHRTHTYGVLKDERLVAYMTIHRAGELGMVSMILGSGPHLGNDVMYLMFSKAVEDSAGERFYWFYNRWDSGTQGLRYYKTRVGFAPCDIVWSLS